MRAHTTPHTHTHTPHLTVTYIQSQAYEYQNNNRATDIFVRTYIHMYTDSITFAGTSIYYSKLHTHIYVHSAHYTGRAAKVRISDRKVEHNIQQTLYPKMIVQDWRCATLTVCCSLWGFEFQWTMSKKLRHKYKWVSDHKYTQKTVSSSERHAGMPCRNEKRLLSPLTYPGNSCVLANDHIRCAQDSKQWNT